MGRLESKSSHYQRSKQRNVRRGYGSDDRRERSEGMYERQRKRYPQDNQRHTGGGSSDSSDDSNEGMRWNDRRTHESRKGRERTAGWERIRRFYSSDSSDSSSWDDDNSKEYIKSRILRDLSIDWSREWANERIRDESTSRDRYNSRSRSRSRTRSRSRSRSRDRYRSKSSSDNQTRQREVRYRRGHNEISDRNRREGIRKKQNRYEEKTKSRHEGIVDRYRSQDRREYNEKELKQGTRWRIDEDSSSSAWSGHDKLRERMREGGRGRGERGSESDRPWGSVAIEEDKEWSSSEWKRMVEETKAIVHPKRGKRGESGRVKEQRTRQVSSDSESSDSAYQMKGRKHETRSPRTHKQTHYRATEKQVFLSDESDEPDSPKMGRRHPKKGEDTTKHRHRRSHRVIETDWSEEDRQRMMRRPVINFRGEERYEKANKKERRAKVGDKESSEEFGRDSDKQKEGKERKNVAKQLCHSLSVQAFLRNTNQHKRERLNPLSTYIESMPSRTSGNHSSTNSDARVVGLTARSPKSFSDVEHPVTKSPKRISLDPAIEIALKKREFLLEARPVSLNIPKSISMALSETRSSSSLDSRSPRDARNSRNSLHSPISPRTALDPRNFDSRKSDSVSSTSPELPNVDKKNIKGGIPEKIDVEVLDVPNKVDNAEKVRAEEKMSAEARAREDAKEISKVLARIERRGGVKSGTYGVEDKKRKNEDSEGSSGMEGGDELYPIKLMALKNKGVEMANRRPGSWAHQNYRDFRNAVTLSQLHTKKQVYRLASEESFHSSSESSILESPLNSSTEVSPPHPLSYPSPLPLSPSPSLLPRSASPLLIPATSLVLHNPEEGPPPPSLFVVKFTNNNDLNSSSEIKLETSSRRVNVADWTQ